MTKIERRRKKLKLNKGELEIQRQLKEAKKEFSFEPHSFQFKVPMTYTPDFSITKADGTKMYLEIKGYHPGMATWCSKIVHFITQNPEIDYRIVFLDAKKKFNKNYKSTMGDWADRKGIKFADKGTIPKEWLEE